MATHLTNPSYAVVTVGAVSTAVAAADADRKTLQIVNISDTRIWLALDGGTPTVEGGIPVDPGCATMIDAADYTNGAVNGISSVAGKKVMVLTDCPDIGLASSIVSISGGTVGGGGGGAGGGNMVYHSPEDFTATYASGTTLTIAGLPYTPVVEQFQSVLVFPASGEAESYTPTANAFSYSAGTLTVDGATFDATDVGYLVIIFGPDKAYSTSDDAQKIIDVAPLNENDDYDLVAEVTNGADDTYDYYIDMTGFNSALIQCELASATFSCTIEVTAQADGTAAASCNYIGVSLPPITVTDGWHLTIPCKYAHVQVVVSGGAGAADWTIRAFKKAHGN